uniref:Cwf21 domain-containing protein n=1 Tax=Strongyloides papillosus TaxID=174720 RepID=A0A0N5B2P8_STREA
MYNGIGLQTARGSGTSGHIQTNIAGTKFVRKPKDAGLEKTIEKAEYELNRGPNLELLEHERKRQVEIKCLHLEDKLEEEGVPEEEIKKQVSELRSKLLEELKSGSIEVDEDLNIKNTHTRQKVLKESRARMRKALKIDDDFVDGSCLKSMAKKDEKEEEEVDDVIEKAAKEKLDKSSLKKLARDILKAEKDAKREERRSKRDEERKSRRRRSRSSSRERTRKRKHSTSSSSSASSSDSSDSDSDSSSDSSSDSDSSSSSDSSS